MRLKDMKIFRKVSLSKILMMRGIAFLFMVLLVWGNASATESTRKERRLITEGNTLYRTQKYADAKVKYRSALEENESSSVARFNLGLCDVRLAYLNKDNDSIASKLITEAKSSLIEVAKLGKDNSLLASKANYNLGNLAFESESYQEAISFYKQALRLNPDFDDARRNLRIAQLKLQNQQNNQDNKDNKEQDKEQENKQDQNNESKQDKQKDQDQDQNKDQNKDTDQDSQDQQNQQTRPNQLSEQAAQQILNAVENNEQKARQGINTGHKAKGHSGRQKRW